MSKRVAVVVGMLLLIAPGVASAQGISGGIKGGVLLASVPDFRNVSEYKTEFDNRQGFVGGGFVTLSLLPGLAIQPEVLFTQKGAEADTPGGTFTLKLDYLDIPVLARLSFGGGGLRVYAFAGPSFNINLTAKAELDTETEDLSDHVEKSEISFVAGFGVEISKLLVEGRWMEGLKNISADPNADFKTRAFAVMAGFKF